VDATVGHGQLVSFYARPRNAAPGFPISLDLPATPNYEAREGQSIIFGQTFKKIDNVLWKEADCTEWPAAGLALLMVAPALARAGYASP
jgi:hypothetical protein